MARRSEIGLGTGRRQRRHSGRLAYRRGRRREPNCPLGLLLAHGQRREGLEPACDANAGASGLADLDAPGQVALGLPGRAEVQGHPPQAGHAARDLRPGADLLQDRQRLHVSVMRLAWMSAEPGQVAEAEQGPGSSPLLIDAPHDRDRGAGQLCGLSRLAHPGRDRRPGAQRVALVPPVTGGLRHRQRLVRPGQRRLRPSRLHGDLAEQVQRRPRPELLARVPAQRQPLLGERFGSGGIAGQGKLRPRHQGCATYPRRRRRPARFQEGIQPFAAFGEGAPDEPARADRDADPQPGFGVVMIQAPGQDLGYVALVDVVPAGTADPFRPGDRAGSHPDRQAVLRDTHHVVAQRELEPG